MKIHALISMLLSIAFLASTHVAFSGISWRHGEIVLTSGKTLSGQLSYKDDVVQCKTDERIRAFSTSQVSHFYFYDVELNAKRVFVPVDLPMNNHAKKPAFYELVSEGSITLLRKEIYTYKMANDPYRDRDLEWETRTVQRFQQDVHMRVKDFEYYYIHNESLHLLHNFRKEIAPLLQEYKANIAQFIEKNSLNVQEIESQIRIVDYFNQLQQENNMALRR